MNTLIFENSKGLSAKDIYLQILIGVGILFLVGVLSPLRRHGQPFSWTSTSFIGFSAILLVIWIFKALRETTLKAVQVEHGNENVKFVLNRQLCIDFTITFRMSEVQFDIKDVPSRSLPREKVLVIKDNQKELKISSRQKGLSESTLKEIAEKLKHYPPQKKLCNN